MPAPSPLARRTALLLVAALYAPSADAQSDGCAEEGVRIVSGAYEGTYSVAGQTSVLSGDNTVPLSQGDYTLLIANLAQFPFQVEADGNVLSGNTAAAEGGACALTFRTAPVTVDPGAYIGTYYVKGVSDRSGAPDEQSFHLLRGIERYTLEIAPGVSFEFGVDADGEVQSLNPQAAVGGAKSLKFNTVTINVVPGDFEGRYTVRSVRIGFAREASFVVLPGVANYILDLAPGNNFRFDVDSLGNVQSQNADAAAGQRDTLAFKTTTMLIERGGYTGSYSIRNVRTFQASQNGAAVDTATVLPGVVGYILDLGIGTGFRFDVDENGNVTSSNPVAARDSSNVLVFQPTQIEVRPGDYKRGYALPWVDSRVDSGVRTFMLLPGIENYQFNVTAGVGFRFDVDPQGRVVSRNTAAAIGDSTTLRLKSVLILITREWLREPFQVLGESSNTDVLEIHLVCGVGRYTLTTGPAYPDTRLALTFLLRPNGRPRPANIVATVQGQEFSTFALKKDGACQAAP